MSPTRSADVARQAGSIGQRSVRHVFRQRPALIAALLFPLFLLAVNVSDLHRVTLMRGFPTSSYLTFALAFALTTGALYTVVSAGTDIAQDIESGFLSRLALTRVRRPALLAGLLCGSVATILLEASVYLCVGFIAGAHVAAGALGVLVIMALCVLMGVAFGAIGVLMALRAGSAQVVQALLPLLFAAMFLSSMNLPRNLIQTTWFRDVATYNPVSYLVEAIRSLMVGGWDPRALALGFGIAGAVAVMATLAAALALRERVVLR